MLYLVAKLIILFTSRYFSIIYFYICGVNADDVKDMQIVLNDIELDIQELKCLLQAVSDNSNPALRTVAKRIIRQMQLRLDELSKLLDESATIALAEPVTPIVMETVSEQVATPLESVKIPVFPESTSVISSSVSSSTLGECIKPITDLRHAISLNDSFRFTRELFDGDATRMNEMVRQLGEANSFSQALDIFNSKVHLDEENVAATDFVELLKKYFS